MSMLSTNELEKLSAAESLRTNLAYGYALKSA